MKYDSFISTSSTTTATKVVHSYFRRTDLLRTECAGTYTIRRIGRQHSEGRTPHTKKALSFNFQFTKFLLSFFEEENRINKGCLFHTNY